jgi:hypothetical protein
MSIRKVPPGSMRGFLISAGHAVRANEQNGGMRPRSETFVREFIVLFGPLPSELANESPTHFRTADAGASPTSEDLRVQKRALALIEKAIEYLDRGVTFGALETEEEYREG